MQKGINGFIAHNERNKKLIKNIELNAKEYIGTPISSLTYSKFRIFSETGSRLEYEADYMEHRKRLCVFAIMYMYESNADYKKELEDILWAICDEFTWMLPAHAFRVPGEKNVKDYIEAVDLFAAETAVYLSEIVYILKDRLSTFVVERVEYEVKRRVTEPYLKYRLKWGHNNWSSVCASAIGMSMIYLEEYDKFDACSASIQESIDFFLDSYEEDGCCKEGGGYWEYGLSFLCYYAQLLREYTNGQTDLFQQEKIKRIAGFGQNIYIEKNVIIPFSDAPHELCFNMGLYALLYKEYGYAIPDVTYECLFGDDKRYRFCDLIRSFCWYESDTLVSECRSDYYFYKDAMWYIKRQKEYFFAAKGGNNDEPHNHNDLGGFVLYADGSFIIDDLGWQEYDKLYFDDGYRYKNYIAASSAGHSVPIICSEYQQHGAEFYAVVDEVGENKIVYDLSRAYRNCKELKREFVLGEKGMKIVDYFDLTINEVTERFVTRIEPRRCGDVVLIGNWELYCPKAALIQITSVQFKPRNDIIKNSMKDVETAYLIDLCLNDIDRDVEIYLRRKGQKF